MSDPLTPFLSLHNLPTPPSAPLADLYRRLLPRAARAGIPNRFVAPLCLCIDGQAEVSKARAAKMASGEEAEVKKYLIKAREALNLEYDIAKISKVYQNNHTGIEDLVRQIIQQSFGQEKQQKVFEAAIFFIVLTQAYKYKLAKSDFINRFDLNPPTFNKSLALLKDNKPFQAFVQAKRTEIKGGKLVVEKPIEKDPAQITQNMGEIMNDPNIAYYGKFARLVRDVPIEEADPNDAIFNSEETEEYLEWRTSIIDKCDQLLKEEEEARKNLVENHSSEVGDDED